MVPEFISKAWQNLRHEGAISNRFLPLRIYLLLGKLLAALVAAGFTLPALMNHYANLVDGNPWIGRLCAGFPEAIMVGLCFVPIFSGYKHAGDVAERWYKALLVAVLLHAGLIYSSSFVERQIDKKVAKRHAERSAIAQKREDERAEKAKTDGEVKNESLKMQAAEIQRIADIQINRNPNRRTLIQEDARKRIQALFESANKPADDSFVPLPSAEEEAKALRNEIKAEMSAGDFGRWMMEFKEGADIYLESPFAIIIPFLLAAFGLGHVVSALRSEGAHEEAAAGKIRTAADKGAYDKPATKALENWKPQTPEVGKETRRFSASDVPPGGVPRR